MGLTALRVLLVTAAAALTWLYVSSGPTHEPPKPRARLRVLVAMDLSTSMRCPVKRKIIRAPGFAAPLHCADMRAPELTDPPPLQDAEDAAGTRIAASVSAVADATANEDWFGPADRVTLWTFSGMTVVDRITGHVFSGDKRDPRPVGTFPAFRPGAFEAGLQPLLLGAVGGTPLNLAILEGVRALRAGWQPGINALVVLTDGYDHTSRLKGRALTEAELSRVLGDAPHKPVHLLVTTSDVEAGCGVLFKDVTAVVHDPKLDCFRVNERHPLATAVEEVRQRLLTLAADL